MDEEESEYWDSTLSISSLHLDYSAGISPASVIHALYERILAYKATQTSLWIHLQPLSTILGAAKALETKYLDPHSRPPLWGVPFSVKDNIDIAGIATTVGCPALSYTPQNSAPVYQKCIDAGALFIGKTNMDQLATGMTGCRSPYGTLHSTWRSEHIAGGSSSGSAVSVGAGLVSFSLGTDTAGSIRVPALFNGIVGFKPTKGTVSARGVVPACRHQDTVGFCAMNVEDVECVWRVCRGFDHRDSFAKRNFTIRPLAGKSPTVQFGVPTDSALKACSPEYRRSFDRVVKAIRDTDRQLFDMDWAPFASANDLLFNRSFVLERLTILPEGWLEKNNQLLHPVTRQVFSSALARKSSAVDAFSDLHAQAECKRIVEDILTPGEGGEEEEGNILRVMIVPTAPFHPTILEVEKDPIGIGGKLGDFSHFGNVLDLVGIALPAGSYSVDDGEGRRMRLPFGVSVFAKAGMEEELVRLVKDLETVFQDMEEAEEE